MATSEDRLYHQLDRIEQKLDKHVAFHDKVHDDIERDLRVRPTRQEIMALFGGAGVLSGMIFGVLKLAGV